MRVTIKLPALLLSGLLAACGGGGDSGHSNTSPTSPTAPTSPTSPGSTSTSITIGNDFFSPSATTIPIGSTVTWTFSGGGVAHNVTFDDGQASQTMSSGTYQRTFAVAGTFNYRCTIHGGMTGSVVVR